MKNPSFALATAVLLAAAYLPMSPDAYGCQQGNADPKPCPADSAACAGQPVAGPAASTPGQAHSSSPAPAEKLSFHILAEFSGGLNTKNLKPGDRIKAQVSQDVLSHGKIIIPEDSRLLGHVTEVKRRGVDDPESRLGLVFDRVLLKHHQELDFQGVVQALSPPAPRRSRVDEPDQMLPPATMAVSQSSIGTIGGSTNARGGSSSGGSNGGVALASMPASSVPVYTESNPGSTVGPDLKHNGSLQREQQTPMSAGMPRGVFGIKGLTLSRGPSGSTPGPVILSSASDVKLEGGTQVLLKITEPTPRQQ
ncbi:MAG TPA: hypothetical protein VIX19_19170 [Terriglobales bacterium]